MKRLRRRRVLAAAGASFAALAGCTEDSADAITSSPTDGASQESTEETTATQTTSSAATEDPSRTLDLREANVVEVTVTDEGDGRYRFDVTLHHDDDGEDGYANWWQVETLDGQKLGRRDLLHPHSEQPFTRSETIEIPNDVDCVVVRGHDEVHGYGGQAMLVPIATGGTVAIDQGTEPEDTSESSCPADA